MPKDTVERYLAQHAEPLARGIDAGLRPAKHAICIPLYDEDERFIETLNSLDSVEGIGDAVVVLVVNGAEDTPSTVHDANRAFLGWLRHTLGTAASSVTSTERNGTQFLVIDCASPGRRFPARQGVGLARKLAGDVALALHRPGTLASPWVACTDADVQLPADYLTALPPHNSPHSAVVYPFAHTLEGDSSQQNAMKQYEAYLHYYVLGLQFAGSPYAYPSIGSTFAVHLERYAAVRGFPRKLAAEDFYLLNKLIKQAPILRLTTSPIRIRGRESTRVPFGTGRAVRDIQENDKPYAVYNPRVFDAVGLWQRAQCSFADNPEAFDWDRALNGAGIPHGLLHRCLTHQGALRAAEAARHQASSTAQLFRRLFEWNDAFRTLRLVHLLRDGGLGTLPLAEAVERAPFVPTTHPCVDVDEAWRATKRAGTPNTAVALGLVD